MENQNPPKAPTPVMSMRSNAIKLGVIAVSAAAVWSLTVRPIVARVIEQRSTLASMSYSIENDVAANVADEQVDATLNEVRARLNRVEQWTLRPGDSGKLYESLRGLAKRFDTRIERIEPKGATTLGSSSKAKPDPKAVVSGETMGYALDVSGRFEAIARFVAACETDIGSSRVVSFRITPSMRRDSNGEPTVTASIETQHVCLSFVQPEKFEQSAAAESNQ